MGKPGSCLSFHKPRRCRSGFRVQSIRSTVTDGGSRQDIHPNREYSHGSRAGSGLGLRDHKNMYLYHTTMQLSLLVPSTSSSTFLSLTPWHTSSSSTSPHSGSFCITPCGTIPRQDEHGPLAADAPLTVYEPKVLEILEGHQDVNQIFTDPIPQRLRHNTAGPN